MISARTAGKTVSTFLNIADLFTNALDGNKTSNFAGALRLRAKHPYKKKRDGN
jgi:hypothetical protein